MSFDWFKRRENIAVICIALLLLILHLVIIDQVKAQMFDEQHYVPEANAIVNRGDLAHLEHPPLSKLFIAAGIELFGDNAFGWRIFSVLFGSASIILFYLVCQELTKRKYVPLLATFLLAFDNMFFVMSSVAMLDVFSFTFMLASFWLYLRGSYTSSGVVLALAALAKLGGAFGGIVIILHWFFTRQSRKRSILKFLIAAPVAFLALMPLFDYLAMGGFHYPWDRLEFMRTQLSSLTFANVDHPALSHPWEWLISPTPAWFWYKPTYQANPNWTIWGLSIPVMCYALFRTIRAKNHPFPEGAVQGSASPNLQSHSLEESKAETPAKPKISWGIIKSNSLYLFAFSWFTGTYLVWIPIVLITDRITFEFYFYPTVGAICLALGLIIQQIWSISSNRESKRTRWAIRTPVLAFLIGHLAVFVIMSPYCGWPPAGY